MPLDRIRYDNLKPAVSRVLCGRTRQETERWVAFRSHYGFDPFYCVPGHEGSHEKGGVEGEGGRFRRNHCVPMPVVESIEELNELLEAWDDADDARRVGNRAMSVGTDGAFERELLRPLPAERFDTALTLTPRVDRYAQVMVRCNQYSCRPGSSATGYGSSCPPPLSPCSTAAPWWRGTSAWWARAGRSSTWTTTGHVESRMLGNGHVRCAP